MSGAGAALFPLLQRPRRDLQLQRRFTLGEVVPLSPLVELFTPMLRRGRPPLALRTHSATHFLIPNYRGRDDIRDSRISWLRVSLPIARHRCGPKFRLVRHQCSNLYVSHVYPRSTIRCFWHCGDCRRGLGVLASRLLGQIVYQANPRDPVVVLGAVLTMALLGLAASALPALRALAVDPSKLMREG